jgi:hypothetical protein
MEKMFVDPMTENILEDMKEPKTLKGLMVRSAEVLQDDNYTHPNDVNGMLFRTYDRVAGMVYSELVNAVRVHENKSVFSKSNITVNPFSVWGKINGDSTTVNVDDKNPMSILKQKTDVTYTGEYGRSVDTMNMASREYHTSEIGVVSEAVPDSSKAGVSAYMSGNPKLTNVRGKVGDFDFADDGLTSVLSPAALLAPFSTTDDTKRLIQMVRLYRNIITVSSLIAGSLKVKQYYLQMETYCNTLSYRR